jgi:hypothetical protein
LRDGYCIESGRISVVTDHGIASVGANSRSRRGQRRVLIDPVERDTIRASDAPLDRPGWGCVRVASGVGIAGQD